ncbi:hypothetical protein E2542_SST19954 [Spatholobus suberectus]|nr:hypothetical protein E2542_SST19954 [Spatholobus suberectus]
MEVEQEVPEDEKVAATEEEINDTEVPVIDVVVQVLDSDNAAYSAATNVFNNRMVEVHGLQDFISLHDQHHLHTNNATAQPANMCLMLQDTMLKLGNNGFSILALAMKVKYVELDDLSIFTGSHLCISHVWFHIMPNHYLSIADLKKLPIRTTLPTLEQCQLLPITISGSGETSAPMKINYVKVKVADVIHNVKIVVHRNIPDSSEQTTQGVCFVLDGRGSCDVSSMPQIQVKPMVEIEDHHGL